MRHVVDFRNTSDTGEIDADAIVPYNDGEAATQAVFRRPVENSRTRSETLRKMLRQHIMLRDNDRAGASIWGGGTITFNGASASYTGIFTIASSIFVAPMLSPGDGVGAAAPYIASTQAQMTVGTFGNNQAIITSVKKQFEGTDQAKGDANRISIEILNDTAESIAMEGAAGDVNNVKIKIISGTTTVQDLIDLINNDVTVTTYVTAALEGTSTGTNFADLWGPNEWGTDYGQRFLTGGFPGVVHEISSGNLATFFAAHADNVLQKGDTLAIAYDQVVDETGLGGTLQSTIENTKTVIPAASLINTRREPARAPNAVPVCKCVDDDTLIFSNNAYIQRGLAATLMSDSGIAGAASLINLATAGWTRMHQAPGAHVPPTSVQEGLNNADDLVEAILTEVEAARSSTVYGANASIDARVEQSDVEINNARNSASYGAKASLDLRLEDPELEIVAARNSVSYGAAASLDARIEVPEVELFAARATDDLQPAGGGFADLDTRLDLHAAHGRTTVSVGTGCMYPDLKSAIDYLLTTDGGTILIKGSQTYIVNSVGTHLPIIDQPIRIIATEPLTIQNDLGTAVADGYMLRFSGGGALSVIDNVQIFEGLTPSNQAIRCDGAGVRFYGGRYEGEVVLTATLCEFNNCVFIEGTNASGNAISYGLSVEIAALGNALFSQCFFATSTGGQASVALVRVAVGETFPVPTFPHMGARFNNCRWTTEDHELTAFFGEKGWSKVEACGFTMTPYTAGTPVIHILEGTHRFEELEMLVEPGSSSDVNTNIIRVDSVSGWVFGTSFKYVRVDLGARYLADYAAGDNPFYFESEHVVVEELEVSFNIPDLTNHSRQLSETRPLIYARGVGDGTVWITRCKITLKGEFVAGATTYSVIGTDTHNNSFGRMVIDDCRFNTSAIFYTSATARIVNYVQAESVIKNCRFVCGNGQVSVCVKAYAHAVRIENNTFDCGGVVNIAIDWDMQLAGSAGHNVYIVGNTINWGIQSNTLIYVRGQSTGSKGIGIVITGNVLRATSGTNIGIYMLQIDGATLLGNVVQGVTTPNTLSDTLNIVPTPFATYNAVT